MSSSKDDRSARPGEAGPRLLIAEDMGPLADAMAWALEDAGYRVDRAQDGEECLELVRADPPDLIILDILMPRLHGMEVLERLKSDPKTCSIPVLISSGRGFRTDVRRMRELGAAGLLVKPFELRALVAEVGNILSRPAGEAAALESPPRPDPKDVYLPRLEATRGVLRFWGTRGSIPISGPRCIRHGGHTSCLELERGEEAFVFDAGSGLYELGARLAARPPRKIHLFITHTHWDHIQGFPFFAPAFTPGFEIVVYGARGFNKDLRSLMRGQLDPDYFPIQMENMDARLDFIDLGDEPIRLGDLEISSAFTQHPGATVGYKVKTPETSFAFVPDNEVFQGYLGDPRELAKERELLEIYRPMMEFLNDVDVLVHEAQYTPEEYRQTVRYGHSSVPNACYLAASTKARRWIIVHHDPNHDDNALDAQLSLTRHLALELGYQGQVMNGYDGMVEYL